MKSPNGVSKKTQKKDFINFPEISAILDTDLKFITANPGTSKFYGDQVIGQKLSKYQKNKSQLPDSLTTLFTNKNEVRLRLDQRRKDGKTRSLNCFFSKLNGENSSSPSILFSAEDITDRETSSSDITRENNFLDIFNSISEGLLYVDLTGKVLECNNALTKIVNIPADKIIGKTVFSLASKYVPKKDLQRLLKIIQKGLSGDSISPFELDYNNKILSLNARFIRESKKIIGLIRDITKQKQYEKSLYESEERHRTLFEKASLGIGYYTTEGRLIAFNSFAARQMGGKPSDFAGKSMVELFGPEEGKKYLQRLKETCSSKGDNIYEDRVTLANGEYWFLTRFSKIKKRNGEISGVQLITTDITEIKKTEEKIRFQAFLLDSAGQAIIATDLRGKIIYLNEAAENLYEWPKEEAVGKNITEVTVPGIDKAQAQKRINNLKKGQQWSGEFLVQTRSGKAFPVFVNDTPFNDEQGNLAGIVGISYNITEQKLIEDIIKINTAKIQSIFRAAPIGMGVLVNRTFQFLNEQFLEMLGFSQVELIGRSSRLIYATDDEFERVGRIKYQNIKKFGTGSIETRFKCKDGKILNILLSSAPIDKDNIFKGVTFSALDITARKLFERNLQRRTNELAILLQISKILSSPVNLYNSLQKVLYIISQLLNINCLSIYTLEGDDLILTAAIPQKKNKILNKSLKTKVDDHPHIKEAVQSKQYVLIEDTKKSKFDPAEQAVVDAFDLRSIIYIPIIVSGLTRGVIIVANGQTVHDFSEEEIAFCQTLTNQIAVSIENSKLFDSLQAELLEKKKTEKELKNYTKRLNSIYELDRSILANEPVTIIAQEVLQKIFYFLPFKFANVVEFDFQNNHVEELCHSSNHESEEQSLKLSKEDFDESLGKSLWRGNFYIEKNIKTKKKKSGLIKYLVKHGNNTLTTIPLNSDGVLIGALNLASDSDEIFLSDNMEIAVEIANLLAVSLRQNKLKKEISKYTNELEQRVKERTEQLEHTNQELREFAQIVSHDLKAPLRAIGQLSHWLSTDYENKLDKTGQEQLSLLVSRVKRMDKLIEGILHYSRAGKNREKEKKLNLNKLVEETITLIGPPDHIEIIIDKKLPQFSGDPVRLSQLFQNLITNAIKFMDKPKGIIKIGCKRKGVFWNFYVSDNGPGIPERYFDHIFKIFQKLESRDDKEGTGVGLSLVKKIVEIYGGIIWLESEVGSGTTFYFNLPAVNKKSNNENSYES